MARMRHVLVLIKEAGPGQALSTDPLDLKDEAILILSQLRHLGYNSAEIAAVDDEAMDIADDGRRTCDVLAHELINEDRTVLRIDSEVGDVDVLVRFPVTGD